MTLLTVLLLTVVSTCLAQPADNNAKDRPSRAPQSQIQYSDPDGSKVDWKLFAPQNQWRSHLDSARRLERAETGTGQVDYSRKQQGPVIQAPVHQVQPQYQPFSSVPSHIKKLIVESYNHQGPYVDPGAFFYQAVVPSAVSSLAPQVKTDQYVSSPTHQLEREYFNSAVNYRASGYQGSNEQYNNGGAHIGRVPPKAGIKYKDEERLTERSTSSLPYGAVIGAQSRQNSEYQPYKQIAQSQHQQFNRQTSEDHSLHPQYKNRNSDSLSPQYSQHNNRNSQINPQYGQYNKQPSQVSQNTQQFLQSKQYKQFESVKPVTQSNFEHNMPMAIQQLLSYQAQLPYNVIANHIVYRPKQLFIPKPLPESVKLAKQYPSKIYFLKTDGQIYDSSEIVKDEKKHEKGY